MDSARGIFALRKIGRTKSKASDELPQQRQLFYWIRDQFVILHRVKAFRPASGSVHRVVQFGVGRRDLFRQNFLSFFRVAGKGVDRGIKRVPRVFQRCKEPVSLDRISHSGNLIF